MIEPKKFLIIGPRNAITYKEIFPLIKDNKVWLGFGFNAGNAYFKTNHPDHFTSNVYNPETELVKLRNVVWFTNLPHKKRHEELILYKQYSPEEYPHYDNYDAIEVSKTKEIPEDWAGVMGVPITFLDKYNPDQFEIVGFWNSGSAGDLLGATKTPAISKGNDIVWNGPTVAKKTLYFRIIIRNKEIRKC